MSEERLVPGLVVARALRQRVRAPSSHAARTVPARNGPRAPSNTAEVDGTTAVPTSRPRSATAPGPWLAVTASGRGPKERARPRRVVAGGPGHGAEHAKKRAAPLDCADYLF